MSVDHFSSSLWHKRSLEAYSIACREIHKYTDTWRYFESLEKPAYFYKQCVPACITEQDWFSTVKWKSVNLFNISFHGLNSLNVSPVTVRVFS